MNYNAKFSKYLVAATAGLMCLSGCMTLSSQEKNLSDVIVPEVSLFADNLENRSLVENALVEYERVRQEHGNSLRINDVDLFYLEWGSSEGIPFIWSHGLSSRSFELVQVAEELVESGYRVIAIDSRGHGETIVSDHNFTLSHIADDINALMNELGIEKAVIGGLSLGGFVSTAFYEQYPDRALALVLEDGGSDHVQARLEKYFPQVQGLDISYGPDTSNTFLTQFDMFREMFELFQSMATNPIPQGAYSALASLITENEDGSFGYRYDGKKLWGDGSRAAFDPSKATELPLFHQSWRRTLPLETYRNLHVPMLIIDPTGDNLDLSAQNESLHRLHPELIEVIEYPDTPHAAHVYRPNWFVRDMKSLKEKLDGIVVE